MLRVASVPAAMFVEIAVDTLKDETFQKEYETRLVAQDREVRSGLPMKTEDFYAGYALGLMVARILLAGMPNAVENNVEI